jgi:CHAT domain-containing protein/tetratricopeptide (TPR) repeat protein
MNPLSPSTVPKPAPSTFRRGIILVLTVSLVSIAIAAQDTKKNPEDEVMRVMTEGMQMVTEGSSASLTKAIEKFESARLTFRALNLPVGDAAMLMMIGYAYSQLEQNQKAIEKYEQSLPLFRAAGEQKWEASALLHLGLIHSKLGEMEKGLDYLGQALALFHAAGERYGEAMALSVIGSLYVLLGKPEELISYYNKVLEMSRATASRESEGAALPAIAPLYKLMGQNVVDQPEKAREGLEQLLSVSRAFHIPRGEALALLALGLDYSFERETQKALSYYEQALPLFRAEHDRPGEGAALFGVCMSHITARDYQKGFNYCSQALALHRAIGDHQAESLTLKQIAIGERDRGDLAASLTAIESAIANVESIRTKVVNPEYRLSYSAGSQDYYEFYVDLLMRLHKQHLAGGYDGKALQASERGRARSLLETLNEANADIRQGVDPALLQRERTTQGRLNAKAQTQLELLSRQHSEAEANAIAAEVKSLIDDLQLVETEIRQASPHYAALMQPQSLSLREIQSQVLDQDTILLEYSIGEEHSYLWAVTSTSITSHELAKGDQINNAARDFYSLLNARNTSVKGETEEQRVLRTERSDAAIPGAAAALSRLVLAPVAGQLGKKRLAIVADGALHFVPFGALPVVADGANTSRPRVAGTPRPLIADHEIVNLPSASTLAVIRTEVAGRQKAPRSVAVLADPVFMKDDERVKTTKEQNATRAGKPTATRQSATERQLIKAAQDTGMANGGFYVPRLPGTRREAEQIVAMVSTVERRLALDFAASRDTATSAELSQYRYVHLSTHGLLNSVHPELSGLVFSLVNERGEPQDGFLLAHEIFNLKLPAEVVVLSACETGIGKDIKGEGLVSLTRGFMYAGAPRVVVSLWGVSDLATTELMVRFYQEMLKEGMPPAAALRAAQLSLMNDKRWASPYYWAPFTLQGEWR